MAAALQFGEPHAEAIALIRGKPPVTRELFDRLLPALRARAFTVTGIEGLKTLERLRDEIAALPAGTVWDDAKRNLAATLEESDFSEEAAARRAELLLRTHGFQAFQSATWQAAQADDDTTHLQYLTMEDDRVRPSHAALDGLILPKDDPFWEKHTPPWDWGCRCRIRPVNPDLVERARRQDATKPPEAQRVLEGPALEQLRNGTRITPTGQRVDVTPPRDRPGGETAFQWQPRDLTLPLEQLRQRFDPELFQTFETWARQTELADGIAVWDYLDDRAAKLKIETMMLRSNFAPEVAAHVKKLPPEVARILFSAKVVNHPDPKNGFYRSLDASINMGDNPREWNGRPELVLHEMGHHIHYTNGTVNDLHVSPDFAAAMKADLKALRQVDAAQPGRLVKGNCTQFALRVYGKTMFEDARVEIARFCDTIGGLTKGKWGWGHKLKFYRERNGGAKEVYAQALSAIAEEDRIFQQQFPNLCAAVHRSIGQMK